MMELMEWRYLAHSQPTIVTEHNSSHMVVLELNPIASTHTQMHTYACEHTNIQVHMQLRESFLHDKLYKL